MIKPKVSEQLKLIAHSQQMLVCAQQQRWDELRRLEDQFQPMLEGFFLNVDLPEQQGRALSAQLLEQNEQIQTLIKQEQTRILALQNAEGRNIKAMQQYLETPQK
ncbi:MAG: flagellar protein FliT [Thiomicrospira sp.]|uniref:flagellar protein FliT n=1 Tax=Thiomicrospira sp. TaxID=935 RepID=UPI001A00F177|nr:flagellar protein FliT [Thiomicrospira sp.]MBE0494473.1 flagellar protein FliT [Thiomicrospira sp.]